MRKYRIKDGLYSTKSVTDKIVITFSIIGLCIVAFSQFYLLFWMIMTSLKDDIDVFISMFGLPKTLHFENYVNVIKLIKVSLFVPNKGYVDFKLGTLIFNSIVLATCLPLMGMIVGQISAYIFAKYQFVGREFMLKINLFVMIFPIVGNLASSLRLNYLIGRYDNLFMMCVTGCTPFGGMSLLIMMSFYNAIPKEMMEAAQIDGAGHFTTFLRIHFPLILPTFLLYYMLAIFGAWNDYMTPLVWLPSYPNVALGMYQFQYDSSKYAATLSEVLAGFVMLSVPTVVFYLINQNFLASRMVMAGLKG